LRNEADIHQYFDNYSMNLPAASAFDTLMENVTDAAVTPHEFVPAAGFTLLAKAGKARHVPTLNEMLEAAGVIRGGV
jgi:hypothetical protein